MGCASCFKCCGPKTLQCPDEFKTVLLNNTALTSGQINHLFNRFCFIYDKPITIQNLRLMKRDFLTVGNLKRNPLLFLILNSMFADKKTLTFVDFATYLCIFQAHNLSTKRERIVAATQMKYKILYSMYDRDKDGKITKEDLIRIVHSLYSDVMDKEHILNIVSIIMSEMDSSNTNQILFNDFVSSLQIFDMEESLVTNIPEA